MVGWIWVHLALVSLGKTAKKSTRIRKRLDRVNASPDWLIRQPNANVLNKPFTVSYHSALVFDSHIMTNSFLSRPFQFLESWCRDPMSKMTTEQAWSTIVQGNAAITTCKKLSTTASRLKVWNKEHFGFSHEKIKTL